MNLEIAGRLTQLRKAKELSQEELASRLGVSRQAVSKWERGESSPDLDNLMALAALYGCSLDQLVHADSGTAVQDGEAEAAGPKEAEAAELPAGSDPLLPHGSFYDQPRFRKDFPYSLVVVVSYLVLGFFFNLWHPGWILFLTIPLYYLPLCAGLAVKAGMKEESAWRAITINPAHVVGIDSRVGSLEVGKDADIAIFDGNPLRDIQCHTKAVFVNGEEVLSQIKTRV